MTSKIIVYAHSFCPSVPAVLGILKRAKVDYEYINIHRDYEARNRVREINNGYESVPTLVFPDGSTLTEPSEAELTRKLKAAGYQVPFWVRIFGYWQWLIIGAGILFAVLRTAGWV